MFVFPVVPTGAPRGPVTGVVGGRGSGAWDRGQVDVECQETEDWPEFVDQMEA